MTKHAGKDKLAGLVLNFSLSNFHKLNEAETRLSYIDPFWEALGWNIRDRAQVQVEKTDDYSRRPDYRFLNDNKTQFFVEAKKPLEKLENPKHIYQTKLYCWNGNVPLAILTDFEEFRPFHSIGQPTLDEAKKGLLTAFDMKFEEYPDRFDDLLNTFGRDAVLAGSLTELLKIPPKMQKESVDNAFLRSLTDWRKIIADNIAKNNLFSSEYDLSEAVQRILDRIVFLRVLYDRDIEETDYMEQLLKANGNFFEQFVSLCRKFAPKYNGLIFNPHPVSENLLIEDYVFKPILKEFCFENSPYRFAEIPVEMLGTIYEQFLGDEVSLDQKGRAVIEQKPEVRKAGGVYYTPQYIVEYIVENTVGKLLENCKTPADVAKLKICDPACGSGSFLLGAFEKLIKWHEKYYEKNPEKAFEIIGKNRMLLAFQDGNDANSPIRLTVRMKGKILSNNIFGVDLDRQATEVAQMSLYIKCLEGMAKEPTFTLEFMDAILPKLDGNIKCGNSLIGTDFISDDFFGLSDKERHKINPFDWEQEFPEIFSPITNTVSTINRRVHPTVQESLPTSDHRVNPMVDPSLPSINRGVYPTAQAPLSYAGRPSEPDDTTEQSSTAEQEYSIEQTNTAISDSNSASINRRVHPTVEETTASSDHRVNPMVDLKNTMLSSNHYYHLTWPTYNSRYSVPGNYGSGVILSKEEREKIACYIDEKIKKENYNVLAINVLHDHVHCIVVCSDEELGKIAGNLKGYSSHEFHKYSMDLNRRVNPAVDMPQYSDGTVRKLWASGFSHTFLNNDEHIFNTMNYIINNHEKHHIDPIDYKFRNICTFDELYSSSSFTINRRVHPTVQNDSTEQSSTAEQEYSKELTYSAVSDSSSASINRRVHPTGQAPVSTTEHPTGQNDSTGQGSMTEQSSTAEQEYSKEQTNIAISDSSSASINRSVHPTGQESLPTSDHRVNPMVDMSQTTKKYSGGFDAVIGNPPWGALFYDKQKIYLKNKFIAFDTECESYIFFIENSFKLIKKDFYFGFIVPSNILTNIRYDKIRELILNSSSIEKLIDYGSNVFQNVAADSSVFILSKFGKSEIVETYFFLKNEKKSDVKNYHLCDKSSFLKNPYYAFNIYVNESEIKIIQKIDEKYEKLLNEYVDISRGIEFGYDSGYVKNTKLNNEFKPLIAGRCFNKYSLNFENKYIHFDETDASNFKSSKIYENKKIFIRRIGFSIVATFDDEGYYNVCDVYNLLLKTQCKLDIKYLLGLLNSKFLSFYYNIKYKNAKQLFPKIPIKNLYQIPVADTPNPAQHDRMVTLVERMLKLNKDKQTADDFTKKQIEQFIARTDKEIDTLVYELYGLTDEEIRIVEGA